MTVAALAIATELAGIAELAIPRAATWRRLRQKVRRNVAAPGPMEGVNSNGQTSAPEPGSSDVGFSCQLKATLCLMAATSQNKLPERKVTCE